jgi:hypothetical protein
VSCHFKDEVTSHYSGSTMEWKKLTPEILEYLQNRDLCIALYAPKWKSFVFVRWNYKDVWWCETGEDSTMFTTEDILKNWSHYFILEEVNKE